MSNLKDYYAVAITRGGTVVGYLPRKISVACSLFIHQGGTIKCVVTDTRCYSADLLQGGLEVPCRLKANGEAKEVATCHAIH